ncbi:MAG: SLC13 family permease [Myxococcota bacterium]
MTFEIGLVLAVLGVTVVLFVIDKLRVDVVAILVMVSLPWLGLVKPQQALAGLSSNAVVSIIAVMILGYGMDRSGIMNRVTRPILRVAGSSERRLVAVIGTTVGIISAFMQNIGAAALFLPALLRISKRLELPTSRLLMPVGFAAIMGGTLTMVASGPLIILNDLLRQRNEDPFGLFDVTPIGLALLGAAILYFLVLGRVVLPSRAAAGKEKSPQRDLIETWRLPSTIFCVRVAEGSKLVGTTIEQAGLWVDYGINLLVLREEDEVHYAPWRYTRFVAGQHLALLGEREAVDRFAAGFGLQVDHEPTPMLEELQSGSTGGFAEVVIRPRAPISGESLRSLAFRKRHSVEPVRLLTGDEQISRDFSDQPLRAGDALIVHGTWDRIRALANDSNFVVLTPVEGDISDRSKGPIAALCFAAAIGLAVAGFPLSISLLTGALAMILLRVVPIDEAYHAVDWRTVFLLAGLIPLGTAMDQSGAAAYVANLITELLAASHPLVLMTAIAALATVFSLFMSNVAATVLLAPLVMIVGQKAGIDGRGLALLVAVAASNSFILPTHQVNALFMSPGGYRNADYLKAGGLMTILFLVIAVGSVYLLFMK